MEWEGALIADLLRMKEEMDRVWDSLLEESAVARERKIWEWVEKLPKFEGTARRNLKSRTNKTIKF